VDENYIAQPISHNIRFKDGYAATSNQIFDNLKTRKERHHGPKTTLNDAVGDLRNDLLIFLVKLYYAKQL
jgi:hypothetical protein